MANTKQLALIGAGAFSDFCLQAYRRHLPGLEVAAVFDTNTDLAKSFAASHQISVVTTSIAELLAIPSDAVVILTPPNTHFDLGRQALAAGKNALIEKPIAFTFEQANELATIAKQNNCRITANLVLRYHPINQQIRSFVQNKTYGQLRSITTIANLAAYPADHWYWEPKISGGFFLNTYTHFFDLYRFISQEEFIGGTSAGDAQTGHDISLQFEQTTAHLTTNLHTKNVDELVQTTYNFDKATITTNGWFPETIAITTPGQLPQTTTVSEPKEQLYGKVLANILADLLSPPAEPVVTPHDLLEAVRVALQLQRSTPIE